MFPAREGHSPSTRITPAIWPVSPDGSVPVASRTMPPTYTTRPVGQLSQVADGTVKLRRKTRLQALPCFTQTKSTIMGPYLQTG